jgi:ferric-dicitrate binding protein FerR (iron transport regulator)
MALRHDLFSQAAAWVIQLEGHDSPERREQFQAWLEASPRNKAAFIRLRTAWKRCDRLRLLRPADGAVDLTIIERAKR